MLNKTRSLCYTILNIIWHCFILINTKNFKSNIKTNGNFLRTISFGKKKTYKVKVPTILYITNWEHNLFKRTNSLNDFFSQLSGEGNSKNLSIDNFNLTPKLKKTVTFFQSMPNDPYYKLKKNLLYISFHFNKCYYI